MNTGQTDTPRKLNQNWFLIILSLIPPLVLIVFLLKFRIEAPVADEWELVPLIEQSYTGDLSFKDLWQQHNEHRLIFSKAILILLIRLTDWTILYELLASVLFASFTLFTFTHLLKRMEGDVGKNYLVLIPAISFFIFGLHQSESWFNGFILHFFLNVLSVTLGLRFLGTKEPTWIRIVSAAFLGIVATFTFASGLLFWPLGMWMLYRKIKELPESWKFLAFWLVVTATTGFLYFYGYEKPSHHPSPFHFLEQPLRAVNYIFAFVGSPLFAFCRKTQEVADWLRQNGVELPFFLVWFSRNAASFAGFIGIILFFYLYKRLKTFQQNGNLLFFLSVGLYVLMTASLSAIGRSKLGVESALSLRFGTIASLFWISVLVFIKMNSNKQVAGIRFGKWNAFASGLIVFFLIVNSVYGALYAVKMHSYLSPARDELNRLQNDELLLRLYPDAEQVRKYVSVMKKYRLSVFQQD